MDTALSHGAATRPRTFSERLNTVGHERGVQLFMVIVLAHWAEHLVQAYQIYGMGWPPPQAGGVLGLWFPWMVRSELLHYGYALVMLVGLWILRHGFVGRARTWWMIAFGIQFWHHIEHALLQGQAIVGINLFNSPVPISIAQLFIPRVELHLIYNTIVFVPMVIGIYHHMFPAPEDASRMRCSCAVQPRAVLA